MNGLESLLGRNGFLPHGYCITWSPELLWSMVGADSIIALAYFSIPLAIASFLRGRRGTSLKPVALLFGAFIFACGTTHVMDVWTIWHPDYGLQALTKVVTAGISIATAIVLWPLLPRAMSVPTVKELQAVIGTLEVEIGRRRTAEETLADTEQTLAVTLASIDAGFLATDRDGRVTRMNAVAERVLGWPHADAAGRSLWDVLRREDQAPSTRARNPVGVMVEEGLGVGAARQVIAIARDGTRQTLEIKADVTHAADGTVRGLAIVFRDVSRLQRAEADALRLAAIVESSNDAIVGKTLDGRITSWNRAAERLFGYRADEAIGRDVQMLIPDDRLDEEMRMLTRLAQGARVPPFDSVRRTRDGRIVEVSLTVSPIRDAQGRVVGASKIARDISAQRRAQAALAESEARLRFTLESAQIGSWDLDLLTGASQRSLEHDRCFGYETLQPDWSFDSFVRLVHPDDRDEVVQTFLDAVSALRDWKVQCRVVWPDASVHWIALHGSIRHEGGKPVRMLGIVQDVTRERQADAARQKSERLEAENRQIQAANRLKSQFLANMSHELRTPLNAIIGFADLLNAGAVPPTSPKHPQFLAHIATSGRHLLQLINDVLDLSKVESGRFDFYPEPVHLPTVVREVRDILQGQAEKKRIAIKTDIDPAVAQLVLDPSRLKQALYNYLANAIKFTPEEGRVAMRARPEGAEQVRIEVEDTGIGISPDDLPRLFLEFQQLDSGTTKQHQGTGLGLALTRRLVEAQGGSVGVRSAPGAGSVFHLVLPRVHEIETGTPARPPRGPTQGRSLLAIEPRHQLVQGLASAGFAVDAVGTGAEAVEHALLRAYDGIALDLVLPDERGLGVLERIRREGPNRCAPVVSVTMPADEGAAAFAIANVLAKPIDTEEIVRAMARFRRPEPGRAPVLVIDDDPLALDLMRVALASIGIDAICVGSGREALEDIDRYRPDAIVLDLMMPEMDGFAVLDALRRRAAWRATPVFIWTSMILAEAEYAALARSAHAIVAKGGGALLDMLEDLKRWRPALEPRAAREDAS